MRVVRLSFVEGTVTMRRPGSDEWVKTTVNTPIEEGFSIATGKGSFAEIEFESGSAVRLGEMSSVDFTQLALTADGSHINHLNLADGYATLNVIPAHHDKYVLHASGVSLTPQGKTIFRTDLSADRLRVEVFKGQLVASDSQQTEKLAKNKSLVRDTGAGSTFVVSNTVQKDAWDNWSAARDQQSSRAYNNEAVDLNAPLFGWDDLAAYGDWGYFPGFGYGWAPYEPLGWSPYASGMWGWYPNWGYTWISGEPWGWLPFHYGFWNFSPTMGWFWMPGSFSLWNPAMVNWYSGPGWIGWTPIGREGPGGAAPCGLGGAGCLIAVAPGTLSSGQPIRPNDPVLVHPNPKETITAIRGPNLAPEPPGIFSGQTAPPPARGPIGLRSAQTGSAAPSSVVMGRQISAEAFLSHSASSGLSGNGPIQVRLGNAMGGQFQPALAAGRVAGSTGKGLPTPAPLIERPQILSRGSFGRGMYSGPGGVSGRGGSSSPGGGTHGSAGISHAAGAGGHASSGGGHGGRGASR